MYFFGLEITYSPTYNRNFINTHARLMSCAAVHKVVCNVFNLW